MSSETNREDALKSLGVAQRKFAEGEVSSARKFAEKSLRLYETPEARKLLSLIDDSKAQDKPTSAKASGVDASGTGTSAATQRKPTTSTTAEFVEEKQTYTDKQIAIVKRVTSCSKTEYYKILDLPKSCEEVHIKKSYKKLALQLHPDKNKAPGADEAFRMVSKAFTVLSDNSLRRIHDQTGSDPESRASAAASPGFSGMRYSAAGGARAQPTPEDLFDMFFNGGTSGFGGSPFGGTTFSFGGPGMRFTTFGAGDPFTSGARFHRRPSQPTNAPENTLLRFAPVILLIFFAILSSLPSLLFPGPPAPPRYSFAPSPGYDTQRTTANYGVNYYVNPDNFVTNPLYKDIVSRNPSLAFQSTATPGTREYRAELSKHVSKFPDSSKRYNAVAEFDSKVDNAYYLYLKESCFDAIDDREDKILRNSGIFGIGARHDKVKELKALKIPACDSLQSVFNVRPSRY